MGLMEREMLFVVALRSLMKIIKARCDQLVEEQ